PRKRPQSARELLEEFRNAVGKAQPIEEDLPSTQVTPQRPRVGSKANRTSQATRPGRGSLVTTLGLLSQLPRKAMLHLFLGLAVVGIVSGLIAALLVLPRSGSTLKSNEPTYHTDNSIIKTAEPIVNGTDRPPPPPKVPDRVIKYLSQHGYKPEEWDVVAG